LVVWLYLIQFCGEVALVGCLSNLCMSMQRHPCTFKEVPPTPTPFMVVI